MKIKLQLLLLLIVFSSASMADTEKYDFSLTNEQFAEIECVAGKGVWDGKVCLEENKEFIIDEYCTLKGTIEERDDWADSLKDMLKSKVVTPYSKTVHINITGSKIDSACNAKVGNFPDTLDSFSVSNWTGCRVEDQDFKIRNYTRGKFVDLDVDIRINRKTGLIDAKAIHKTNNTGYYKETQASGICPDLVKNSKSKKSVSNNNPSTINKTPKKSRGYSSGTGFYVNKKGLMITNNHVVKSCNKIKVDGSNAVVKSFDTTNDLALLKVDSSSSSTPDFRAGRGIRLGDGVTVAGYPLRRVLGSGLNVVTGTVASLSGVKNNSSRLQITAPINSGNSGGPLFDSSGRVVGVIVSKINNTKARKVLGEEIQGANFAIKGSVVRSFLDMNDVDYEVSTSNKNMSTADIAENAKEYTALIKCWK